MLPRGLAVSLLLTVLRVKFANSSTSSSALAAENRESPLPLPPSSKFKRFSLVEDEEEDEEEDAACALEEVATSESKSSVEIVEPSLSASRVCIIASFTSNFMYRGQQMLWRSGSIATSKGGHSPCNAFISMSSASKPCVLK